MSSTLTIVQTISPALIGLSCIIPFVYGWVKKSWYSALSLGWCLFILSSLLSPIYTRLDQLESINKDSTDLIGPSQPNLVVALCIGWVLPICGYFLGKKLGELKRRG